MSSEAERYRANAGACKRRAEGTADPMDQAMLRQVVDAWLLLAELLEGPVYNGGLVTGDPGRSPPQGGPANG